MAQGTTVSSKTVHFPKPKLWTNICMKREGFRLSGPHCGVWGRVKENTWHSFNVQANPKVWASTSESCIMHFCLVIFGPFHHLSHIEEVRNQNTNDHPKWMAKQLILNDQSYLHSLAQGWCLRIRLNLGCHFRHVWNSQLEHLQWCSICDPVE